MRKFKELFEGIQCDSENKMFYVANNDEVRAAIDLPVEYWADFEAAEEIEDPEESYAAFKAIEERAEADDSVWKALEEAATFRTFSVYEKDFEHHMTLTDPVALLTTRDKREVIAFLRKVNATDTSHCVEIYTTNKDGEFVDGSDFDIPSNFIARFDF